MIYFIEAATVPPLIKIGLCDGHLRTRISNLQAQCPIELKLLGLMEGSRREEKRLHARFKSLRVRGEWFAQSPGLSRLISSEATATDSGEGGRMIGVRVTSDLHRRIAALARKEKRTLSDYVRLVIEDHDEKKRRTA